jgi:hypothetical protein
MKTRLRESLAEEVAREGMPMEIDPDELMSLQRERNVWRAIAIGLAITLVLLIGVGSLGGLLLAKRSHHAMRAEVEARMMADEARERAEAARQAAEKAKRP